MGACRIVNPFTEFASGPTCPTLNSSAGLCPIWEEEYHRARDVRMWTRAKDLVYGYALLWTFLCLPRLCNYLKRLDLKRSVAWIRLVKGIRRGRCKTDSACVTKVKREENLKFFGDSGCPVCLATTDEMAERIPVAGPCGHTLCAECFAAMWNHGKVFLFPISCPLCMAPIHKVVPAVEISPDQVASSDGSYKLDQLIRRYNLIFGGVCVGIFPSSIRRNMWTLLMDGVSRLLRLGYFFVMFDRKMMNTVTFFILHFIIAVCVEYFENTYLQNLLEHM
ncbi:uncharacterized protein LOC129599500 [Paramacrobiotus metropolitanus]|uniref:uncharacterized protein LOC129599500 n=1 Tax=Paramacrobiotus metropolitanus TaxID=2943436 RepID=UPI0024458C8E|nr:uncharacterized protein LOC129599500 [Paramacrobiotus metropolitanus]